MTILSIAISASLARAAEARRAVALARDAERRVTAASAFLDRVVLWPRDDLDRHLGSHQQGPWILAVDRVSPTLYAISLADSTGRKPLLNTLVYRPGGVALP